MRPSLRDTGDQGVEVRCPADVPASGETMTCNGFGLVANGDSYTNIVTVTSTSEWTDREVSDSDSWSVLIREIFPGFSIVKRSTHATDGGSLLAGSTVEWNYTVTNTGEEALLEVEVLDDQRAAVTCSTALR